MQWVRCEEAESGRGGGQELIVQEAAAVLHPAMDHRRQGSQDDLCGTGEKAGGTARACLMMSFWRSE